MFARTVVVLIAVSAISDFASAAPYENSRFGYSIDLPSDFKLASKSDNGDGLRLVSRDGAASLSVWGNVILEGGFKAESDARLGNSIREGWVFTYDKRGPTWASYSGTRADRIVYIRHIALCEDLMGSFSLDYPATQQKVYGPIIDRLVKSLTAPKTC